MTIHSQMVLYLIACILIHSLLKIRDINNDLTITTYKQVFVKYWRYDWPIVFISLIAGIVFVYTSDEWLPMNAVNITENAPNVVKENTVIGMVLSSLGKAVKILSFTFGLIADWAL